MSDRIWIFERIPDTTGNLQCWKTVVLNYYDLPELGIHFSLIDGQDIVTVEELQILKRMVIASLGGLKVADGQMIENMHKFPIFIFKVLTPDGKDYMQIVISDSKGKYPWEPDCDEVYKHQIAFDTDKVFYIVTQNKWRVNYLRRDLMLKDISPDFKKRADGYIFPIQYIVNNELFRIGAASIKDSSIGFVREIAGIFEIDDLSIICKDTDYSDPINKQFKLYKERHIDLR